MHQLSLDSEPRSRATHPTHPTTPTPDRTRQPAEPVIYAFDRRRHPRRDLKGSVTAVRREHSLDAYRHRLIPVELHDISTSGLGVRCDSPIEIDESITIHFPPHGFDCGFILRGHVVRCDPVGANVDGDGRALEGYEVGVRLDPREAA